jgi:hypothetical protein
MTGMCDTTKFSKDKSEWADKNGDWEGEDGGEANELLL